MTNPGSDIGEDIHLIELCKTGDKTAFARLISIHRRLIETAAFRIVKNNAAMQEVIQETMIRIFKGLHAFNGKCKLSTWIYRITINEGLRYLQKENSHTTFPLDKVPEIPMENTCSLQGMVNREQTGIMKSHLSELPADFKEVVMLHYFEEMKLEDIAVKLNIPRGTVHSRIGRARELLKEKIKSYV